MMTTFRVQNKYLGNERVANATVSIHPAKGGAAITTKTTNRVGEVVFDTTVLDNAIYILRVTALNTNNAEVGPATTTALTMATLPSRIYKTLDVNITIFRGQVTQATLPATQLGNGGTVQLGSNPQVIANLQPVWMQSPNYGNRVGGVTVDKVIIHHTGGNSIQSALNTFLATGGTSPHYVIDTEGYIIKMVQEIHRANHAGTARWRGSDAINDSSIGIEIVHQTGDYPMVQYTSVIALLRRIQAAYSTIVRRNIIGHSDVGVNAAGQLGRKATDPGSSFNWQLLEAQSLGLGLGATPDPMGLLYGNFFTLGNNLSFQLHDSDTKKVYGGKARKDVKGQPIQEIQNDLTTIGYSVGAANGVYGEKTYWGVKMFQEHFNAGGRGPAQNGQLDYATAVMLKRVVAGL